MKEHLTLRGETTIKTHLEQLKEKFPDVSEKDLIKIITHVCHLFHRDRIWKIPLEHIKGKLYPRLPEHMGICFDLSKTLNRNEQCNEDKQFLHITSISWY